MTCIGNWQDLFDIFQKEARENRTTLIPSSRKTYPMLLIHIRNLAQFQNSRKVAINSSSCQLSDVADECAMIAIYSNTILEVYPEALLMSLSFVTEYFKNFQY